MTSWKNSLASTGQMQKMIQIWKPTLICWKKRSKSFCACLLTSMREFIWADFQGLAKGNKEDASISGASFCIIEVYGYEVQIEEDCPIPRHCYRRGWMRVYNHVPCWDCQRISCWIDNSPFRVFKITKKTDTRFAVHLFRCWVVE